MQPEQLEAIQLLLFNSVHIPSDEFFDWLNDAPTIAPQLETAYAATMPDITNIKNEKQAICNHHFVNNDFHTNPKYVMGYQLNEDDAHITISMLYVFPDYRYKGYAKTLINAMKYRADQVGIIQVSVDPIKNPGIKEFYKKLGFVDHGTHGKDDMGVDYHDLFWCADKLNIKQDGKSLLIRRIKNEK